MSEYICPNCGGATMEVSTSEVSKTYPSFACNNLECRLIFKIIQRGGNE